MHYKITNDGSKTLFSQKYNQTFHSMQDGALSEALHKHIIPAFSIFNNAKELNILDICFGLGYNIFATIYYIIENKLDVKVNFYSPELDGILVESLHSFEYPKEFDNIKHIIDLVIKNKYYNDENFKIHIYIGNARDYVSTLKNIDIVYQDAFSSDTNKELWTREYFGEITRCISNFGIITTYSIATPVRMSMYENNFYIYEYQSATKRRGTIASILRLNNDGLILKLIDMEQKKLNSPNCVSLLD